MLYVTSDFLLTDQVGTLRAVADTTGAIVKRIDYDSFGNIVADTNPSFSVPFGFAGGLHDRDTGLVRFGYRDYSPELGRFAAKDPIDFAGGDTNLYAYVTNDPVNLIDPSGLWSLSLTYYGFGGVPGAGIGGTLTFGSKDGRTFAGLSQVGVGVGVGFFFSPQGGPPKLPESGSVPCGGKLGYGGVSINGSLAAGLGYGLTGNLGYASGMAVTAADGKVSPFKDYEGSISSGDHGIVGVGLKASFGIGIDIGGVGR